MTGAFISLSISRWMAKRAYGIQLIDGTAQDYRAREIYDMVARLSKKAGLPAVPEVGVYNSAEPNAFATGPSKKKSLVAFSTGPALSMDQTEVEAVAAHEMSHIANGDMVTMTLLTGVANALVMFLARIIAQALNSFLSDDDDGGLGYFGYIMTVMLLETVLMLLASIPLAAFSRFREYRADAGSARITSPAAMASALERLQGGGESARKEGLLRHGEDQLVQEGLPVLDAPVPGGPHRQAQEHAAVTREKKSHDQFNAPCFSHVVRHDRRSMGTVIAVLPNNRGNQAFHIAHPGLEISRRSWRDVFFGYADGPAQ